MKAQQRIEALDVLRGLALAGMLLVNNPGSWSHVYAPLLHAPWNGLTPTDLVFPFFLFVVGAAMAYSFQKDPCKQQPANLQFNWLSIYRRTLLLIGIGILLSAFPYTKAMDEWRLPGVLQRIGLCYFIVACLLRYLSTKQLYLISVLALLTYYAAMHLYSATPYLPSDNVVRHVDILLLGESHLYKGLGFVFDPEGLLSTLPAAVTTLSGYLVTRQLQQCDTALQKIKWLMAIGMVCICIALMWHLVHPINKSLWTGSYVLISTGIACFVLALIIASWDVWNVRFGLNALKVYGSNPILIFVLSGLLARILYLVSVDIEGNTVSLKELLYDLLPDFLSEKLSSLIFATLFMLSFYVLALALYRKKIFIKL